MGPCRNSRYLAKMGSELTLGDTNKAKNGNRSMWQVAQDGANTGGLACTGPGSLAKWAA